MGEYDILVRDWLEANLIIADYKIANIFAGPKMTELDVVISGIPMSLVLGVAKDALVLTSKDVVRVIKYVSCAADDDKLVLRVGVSIPIHMQKYIAGSNQMFLQESAAKLSILHMISANNALVLQSSDWGQDIEKLFGGENGLLIDSNIIGSSAQKFFSCSNAATIRASFKLVEHDFLDPSEENSMVLTSYATVVGVRLRLLSQVDPYSLADLDQMSLEDLDIIII